MAMSLAQYRAHRGVSLEQAALEIGLSRKSRGHLSRIENGAPASIGLALRIEGWSNGVVPAATIVSEKNAAALLASVERARDAAAGSDDQSVIPQRPTLT